MIRKKAPLIFVMVLSLLLACNSLPVLADTPPPVLPNYETLLSAGPTHSLRLHEGEVYAWGSNQYGEIGDGTTIPRNFPVKVKGLSNVISVSAGMLHSLALKDDGTVWTWGITLHDEVNRFSTVPVQVPQLTDIIAISAGETHNLALKKDGTVWVWGLNSKGQYGDGTTNNYLIPKQVPGLENITIIAAGANHNLAYASTGNLWAWGDNTYGQLGSGDNEVHLTPVQVKGVNFFSCVIQLAAGQEHSLYLSATGPVYSWGRNQYGQLGSGNNEDRNYPDRVGSITASKISAGYNHNLALSDGWVDSWGDNRFSQLGNPAIADREYLNQPIEVGGQVYNVEKPYVYLNEVTEIAAGYTHNLVIENGRTHAWGANMSGQLGDGTMSHRALPHQSIDFSQPFAVLHRLGGQNRMETAVAISRSGWLYGSNTVVLATAENFPDALSGTPLASALAAPILLTNNQTLSPESAEEIKRLNPKEIILLGGTGPISKEIEDNLAKNYKVTRLGGVDRYETGLKIVQYMKEHNLVKSTKAVVAYGQSFADALAVSSLAAYQGIPILLSETNALPSSTQSALRSLKTTDTIIVGGTGVISTNVEQLLPNAIRYGGANRYETSLLIAKNMAPDTATLFFANGENFPDALAGSVLASYTNSPLILINNQLPQGFNTFLGEAPLTVKNVYILGGTGVVSDSLVNSEIQSFGPFTQRYTE